MINVQYSPEQATSRHGGTVFVIRSAVRLFFSLVYYVLKLTFKSYGDWRVFGV
jgi:hypothetical protein